jgi:hypothetical protein
VNRFTLEETDFLPHEPGLHDTLSKGNHHKTWWLCFGTVAPDQFALLIIS